jgi:hypothetical protein
VADRPRLPDLPPPCLSRQAGALARVVIEASALASEGGWGVQTAPAAHFQRHWDGGDATWKVEVLPRPGRIARRVWMNDDEWVPNRREWCPEMTIWPAWSPSLPDEIASTPLQGVHDYWSASGDRLRGRSA